MTDFHCTCCLNKAHYSCITCGDILCVDCRQKHLKSNASKDHEIEAMEPYKVTHNKEKRCNTHDLPMKLWCKMCKTGLCFECVQHINHDVFAMEYYLRQRKNRFEKERSNFTLRYQAFLDSKENIEAYKTEIGKQGKKISQTAETIRNVVTELETDATLQHRNMEDCIYKHEEIYNTQCREFEKIKNEFERQRCVIEKGIKFDDDFPMKFTYPTNEKPLTISKFEPGNVDKGALRQMFGCFSTEDGQPDSGVWIDKHFTNKDDDVLKDAVVLEYSISAFPHLKWMDSRVKVLNGILKAFGKNPNFESMDIHDAITHEHGCFNILVVPSSTSYIESLISDKQPENVRLQHPGIVFSLVIVDITKTSPMCNTDIPLVLDKIKDLKGYTIQKIIVTAEKDMDSKLSLDVHDAELVPNNSKSMRRAITSFLEQSYIGYVEDVTGCLDKNDGLKIKTKYQDKYLTIDDARELSMEIRQSIMQPLTSVPKSKQHTEQTIQPKLIQEIQRTLRRDHHPNNACLKGYGFMWNGNLRVDINCLDAKTGRLKQDLETLVKRYGHCPEIRFGQFRIITTVAPGDKIIPNPTTPQKYGTIGTIAKSTGNRFHALTCLHVVNYATNPECLTYGRIVYKDQEQDFAAIEVNGNNCRIHSTKIRDEDGKQLHSTLRTKTESLNKHKEIVCVHKKGASTGTTSGIVVSDGYTYFDDSQGEEKTNNKYIMIKGQMQEFGEPGDSGSIVYRYDPDDADRENIELISMFQGVYNDRQSASSNETKEIATVRLSRSVCNAKRGSRDFQSLDLVFE